VKSCIACARGRCPGSHRESSFSARIRAGEIGNTERKETALPNPRTKKAPTPITAARPRNIEEQIRRRAYELYESRGREDGRDLEDWFRAEAEITGKAAKAARA
jgi:hypothetical protein